MGEGVGAGVGAFMIDCSRAAVEEREMRVEEGVEGGAGEERLMVV